MTTATAATPDPAEESRGRRPGPAQPPTPQPAPKPPAKPPERPPVKGAYEDDPAPPAPPPAEPPMDERLVRVGQRLQLLVEATGEHIGEARAIAGVLRPDGAAYGRMTGLLQALEYDREAIGRAIAQLHQAATALAREQAQAGSAGEHPGLTTQTG